MPSCTLQHTCSLGFSATGASGFQQSCQRTHSTGVSHSAVTAGGYRQPQQWRQLLHRQRHTCVQHRSARTCAAAGNHDDNVGADASPQTGRSEIRPIDEVDDQWPSDAQLDAAARNDPSVVTIPGEATEKQGARDLAASRAQQGAVAEAPPSPRLLDRVPGGAAGRYAAIGTAGFLALTFVIGVVRAVRKFRSPRAVRVKTVNKNKTLVGTLSKYFPGNRDGFTQGEVRSLKVKTRFSEVEMFRKFVWYLLRERSFDPAALEDTIRLKAVLGLSQEQVADALKERSERIYKKYGSVMLDTEGMTKGGIERKATCRALFSKLLYLAESEDLLPDLDQESRDKLVRDVFGATQDDLAQLRIVSLLNVDADTVDRLAFGGASANDGDLPQDLDDETPAA